MRESSLCEIYGVVSCLNMDTPEKATQIATPLSKFEVIFFLFFFFVRVCACVCLFWLFCVVFDACGLVLLTFLVLMDLGFLVF